MQKLKRRDLIREGVGFGLLLSLPPSHLLGIKKAHAQVMGFSAWRMRPYMLSFQNTVRVASFSLDYNLEFYQHNLRVAFINNLVEANFYQHTARVASRGSAYETFQYQHSLRVAVRP